MKVQIMQILFRFWFGSVSFPGHFLITIFDMVAELAVRVIETAIWLVSLVRWTFNIIIMRKEKISNGIIISRKGEKSICSLMIIDSILEHLLQQHAMESSHHSWSGQKIIALLAVTDYQELTPLLSAAASSKNVENAMFKEFF